MAHRGEKPHLRKRGARSWGLTHRDASGRRVETTIRAGGKLEARRLADEYLALQERIRLGLEKAIVAITLFDAYLEYATTASAKPSWKTEEGRWRLHILQLDEQGRPRSAIARKMLHAITTHDVELLLLEKYREGYSPQQVKHLMSHLRRLFTWAIRDARKLRGENPCSFAKLPEEVPEPDPKAMTVEQLEQLFNRGVDNPDDLLLLLGATYSGERRKELIHMIWPNVLLRPVPAEHPGEPDQMVGWFHVENSARVKTKTRRSRDIPIHPDLLPYVLAARRRARSLYVFPDRKGQPRAKHFKAAEFLRSRMVRAGLIQGYRLTCRKRGERKNPRQKLTLEQAKEVRERARGGESQAELARAFGVSARAVSLILSGKNYPTAFKAPGGCGWESKELAREESTGACPTCGGPLRAEAVPLPFTFKDLRSTFGTHATETAGSIAAVRDLLGHASEDTTRKSYLKRRTGHLQEAMQRVRIVPADRLPTSIDGEALLLTSTTAEDAAQPLN
jgi:integrase